MKAGSSMKKKGLTLVELLVTLAIFGIVISLVMLIFVNQTRLYNKEMNAYDAETTGNFCLNSISESIRLATNVTLNTDLVTLNGIDGVSKQIIQVTPYGGVSSYQYIFNHDKLYKYTNDTNFTLIASNVNNITVTQSNSVYTIYVEAKNGSSIKAFTTSVTLRNRGI
jgi:prepilin-type N-terminal cleavage/methylation domain-containing protein